MNVKRLLVSALVLVMMLGISAAPAAAKTAAVRLPTGAADWATFTPAEQKAAYDWVYNHEIKPSKATPTIVATAPAVFTQTASSGVAPMATTAISVGGECGFGVVQYSYGTVVSGWSQVHTSQQVAWLDTGLNGRDYTPTSSSSYIDQLWRNGAKSYWTYGAVAPGTYVYASTSQDFKWFWESVHYFFQAWDSVKLLNGTWYWRNAYCNVSYNA
jgi:hypothetical protein